MFQALIQLFKILLLGLFFSGVVSALSVVIMDRDLQNTLGTGQSVNGKLTLRLVGGASGPVVVFIKTDDGQTQSYPGVLRGGQLSLNGASLAGLLASHGVSLVLSGGSGGGVSLGGGSGGAVSSPQLPVGLPSSGSSALKTPPVSAPVKSPPVSAPLPPIK